MKRPFTTASFLAALAVAITCVATPAVAATASQLNQNGAAALKRLLATNPGAKALSKKSVAILVFPKVVKAGLMVGGQYGEGVLFRDGKPTAYYSTAGASYGLQAGAQHYGFAMFFQSEDSLAYLDSSKGFEIGVGPSVVMADESFAKTVSSTTIQNAIYAFIFDQKGAMAGVGIQGNKVTKINPK